MAGRKLEHLNERIRQKLGTILIREARDPRFKFVTITGVGLAKDMSFATVQYSCLDRELEIEALTDSLNRAAGFFSHILARTLETRKTPRLKFVYDPGFDHAQEIDALLAQVNPQVDPTEE
ncbi:MAG: 30S ribosome-binding factor RbfA [SAR324 cluster bacterium]|nr:30S ribosome-binding factor RbfA [SAR324 cluster bacterium]MCZ6532146.1 30S ribosome-binding factor RbfA [SAR324 cluster bacterium]MCZ6558971.1 30S ribosome-binding factor RbfA [SAR324 cluster bacterium]MCZ6628231.1 30S ribosome-binding factor RbfA [SAR324 cluster bacterium]MCZ6646063.1 30S ribosome-binding factor RbfA [SAR324 cluster bacterium]